MKIFIYLIPLFLMVSCGKFNEEGSEDNPVAATDKVDSEFNTETQLYSINHRGFETNSWVFNFLGRKINVAETGPFDQKLIAEMYQDKTVTLTKKFADGTKMECTGHLFIGVLRKNPETGKPSAAFHFSGNDVASKCNLRTATIEFSFTQKCQDYGTRDIYPCSAYDIVLKELNVIYGN